MSSPGPGRLLATFAILPVSDGLLAYVGFPVVWYIGGHGNVGPADHSNAPGAFAFATACRPGELLSLQWKDVNLKRRELTIRAEKSKTRTGRIVPISTRLLATLEMRTLDPAGEPHKLDAFVFGNAVGERSKSVRTAWVNATEKAGLTGLQLRDLRHEAGSRFDEAGCQSPT